jgi:hypothetical protein
MKNKQKAWSIALVKLKAARWTAFISVIALITVIGFSMAACGGKGGVGTFKLTDIPSQCNGKYVVVFAVKMNASLILVGTQDFNKKTTTVTLSPVSNGSVTVPMWKMNILTGSLSRYSGNDTVDAIIVGIHDSEKIDSPKPADIIGGIAGGNSFIGSIKFSNGSATKAWDDGMGGGLFEGKNLGDMLKGLFNE